MVKDILNKMCNNNIYNCSAGIVFYAISFPKSAKVYELEGINILFILTLKPRAIISATFIVTGDIGGCRCDINRGRQWQQSCH